MPDVRRARPFKTIETLVLILREQALGGVKMSDNHAAVHDSLRRQLAAVNCVAPIVDCIRKMRVAGLADNEIAGLFRHAADELDEATMTKDGEVDPAA
jgi:hypothetical protein